MSRTISVILFLVGSAFLISAIWLRQNIDQYSVVAGEWVPIGYPGLNYAQTVIEPNQTVSISEKLQTPDGEITCLVWDAEKGPASLTTRTFRARPGETLQPSPVRCLRPEFDSFRINFTSTTRQTVRVTGIHLSPRQAISAGGYSRNLCVNPINRCVDRIEPAANRGSREEVFEIATTRANIGLAIGGLAIIFYIGIGRLVITIGTILFPSREAAAVRREMRRTTRRGRTYNAKVNQPYLKRSRWWFRRKQDIDDLDELIKEAKRDLSQAERELDRQESQKEKDIEAIKEAERERDEAVKQSRQAQARLEEALKKAQRNF